MTKSETYDQKNAARHLIRKLSKAGKFGSPIEQLILIELNNFLGSDQRRRVPIPISQQALAKRCSCVAKTIARTTKKLEDGGFLRTIKLNTEAGNRVKAYQLTLCDLTHEEEDDLARADAAEGIGALVKDRLPDNLSCMDTTGQNVPHDQKECPPRPDNMSCATGHNVEISEKIEKTKKTEPHKTGPGLRVATVAGLEFKKEEFGTVLVEPQSDPQAVADVTTEEKDSLQQILNHFARQGGKPLLIQ